jgi:quercetin dioxygenase-like cupin family protein
MELQPLFVPPKGGDLISPIGGDVTTYKAFGKDTGGQYAVLHQVVTPTHGVRKHVHTREEEAFFIIEGEFTFEVGNQQIKAEAGSFVLGPRGIPHKFWNSSNKTSILLLIISPSGLEPFFLEFSELIKTDPHDLQKQEKLAEKYGISFVE